jgi:hypothetical protein
MNAHAFWIASPSRGEIRPETLPDPSSGEVIVRALFSGISRGTEVLVFRGRVPVGEYRRMRAPFQSGEFPGPVKYGYASVGEVERGPAELEGRRVFVLHPHQTRYVVPASSVYELPSPVPAERAVLAANMETAINGLWDARAQVGDRIAVIGGGTIGCLVAWLAGQMPGCDVELVDVNPAREDVARALGVRYASPETASGAADVVVHASGTAAGLAAAIRIAAFESTIVELSWHGSQQVPLELGGRFHSQRLTLKSSQVGSVAESQRSRWTIRRRMELAVAMLDNPVLDRLITGESAFEDLPAVMERLASEPGDALCHRIRY